MQLTLHLTHEAEANLLKQVRATGKNAEDLASEAVAEHFSLSDSTSAPGVSTNEWLRLFDAWVDSHASRNPRVDDSRESMYPDRT